MFATIDVELEDLKIKINIEKSKLKNLYYEKIKSKDFKPVLNFKVEHEENIKLYEEINENLFYNFVKKSISLSNIEECFGIINIFEHPKALAVYLRKLLDAKHFIRTKKYLNYIIKNKMLTNEFMEIQDELIDKYYSGFYSNKEY